MNELEAIVRLVNKLTDWEEKACNIFYVTEGHVDISSQNLKTTFDRFITENFSNVKFESIEELKDKFNHLSYEEKTSYFKPESIYVLDCTNINKDNIYIFNTIFDLTKEQKISFIHYVTTDKYRDYLIQTQTYHLRTRVLENIDESLSKIYKYHELNDEITATKQSNIQTKKIKM